MAAPEYLIEVNDYEVDLSEGSSDYDKIAGLRVVEWEPAKFRSGGAWIYHGVAGVGRLKGSADAPVQGVVLEQLGLEPGAELTFDPNGWDHEHCTVCAQEIVESDDPILGSGYRTAAGEWICGECHRLFISPDAVFESRFPADPEI